MKENKNGEKDVDLWVERNANFELRERFLAQDSGSLQLKIFEFVLTFTYYEFKRIIYISRDSVQFSRERRVKRPGARDSDWNL